LDVHPHTFTSVDVGGTVRMSDLTNGRSAILIGHTGRFQAIDSVYVDGIPTALGGDGGDDTARDWTLLSGVALVAFLPTSQIPGRSHSRCRPVGKPQPNRFDRRIEGPR
jgi:hypothetical protein